MLPAAPQRLGNRFGGEHRAFHRGVAALDARHVDEARRAADQQPARKFQLRHRLPAAFVDRPRAIGDALAPFEDLRDRRMMLPALEFLIRADIGIGVIERGDETQRHLPIRLVIEEPATPAPAFGQRPALGVDHPARNVLFRCDVPQFLDTQAVYLRLAALLQPEARLEPLGQMAARAFREESVFRMQFHAGLVVGLVAAVLRHAHVLRHHAHHRAAFVIKHVGGGEAGEYLHPQPFGLLGQPAAQIAERAGVAALVRHQRRHQRMRHACLAPLGEQPVPIVGDGDFGHRAAGIAPFGQQFVERARIDHCARKDMRADFGAFLQDADRAFGADLLQPDRSGQAGHACPDDHHVVRHRFAFAHPVRSLGRSRAYVFNRVVEP